MIECVAEFTTNHLGNFGLLRRMVVAAAAAGATWIKMQKKDVGTFYTQEKLDTPFDSPYGKTYREYRELFEFGRREWAAFANQCISCGVPWFSTMQDRLSLEFLLGLANAPSRYKVASSNARDVEFLKHVADKVPVNCEIVVSLAGTTLDEISRIVRVFEKHERLWLLHCVAEYPCPPKRLRLRNLTILREEFASDRVRIGYSGHEVGIAPSVLAMDMGAEMIERHFCVSRSTFAHHIDCSLEPDEFAELVRLSQPGCDRACVWHGLPEEVFDTGFGMSDNERAFLIDQTYGTARLGVRSIIDG